MYQFFIEESQIKRGFADNWADTFVVVSGADYHHMRNVLRLKPGEEVAAILRNNTVDGCNCPDTSDPLPEREPDHIFSETREYRCEISEYDDEAKEARLTVRFIKEENVELPCRIYLFQGMPKGDKFELIIQKAVELGAYQIIPVDMRRSVKKLDVKKQEKVIARYNAISEAAAKQAKRGIIPEVKSVVSFPEAMRYCESENIGIRLVPYELCDTSSMEKTRKLLNEIRPGASVAVLIGPEGGFEEGEIRLARENGFSEITLGRRILRTETAGMTVLSWLMYLLEI